MLFLLNLFIVIMLDPIHSCPEGTFRLNENMPCHPFLNCEDANEIVLVKGIGFGAVKTVHSGNWNGLDVAVSTLRNVNYINDFWHQWNMLKKLEGHLFVKPLGFCNESNVIVTEYHRLGNAVSIISNLGSDSKNPVKRLQLCLTYAEILKRLHAAKLVNCDSNSLEKTLSQLLITDDYNLVLNDLDSLAEINGSITCGSRPLEGEFVAPEQLGYPLPKYDEKTDIWKAATICNYFLSDASDISSINYYLFEIHKRCKSKSPTMRPTADDLVQAYRNALKMMTKDEL